MRQKFRIVGAQRVEAGLVRRQNEARRSIGLSGFRLGGDTFSAEAPPLAAAMTNNEKVAM